VNSSASRVTPSPSTLVTTLFMASGEGEARPRCRYPVDAEDYAVDVKLSTGRYEVKGQYLYWYYSIHSSPSSEEHVVSITIRRSGSPITPSLLKRLGEESLKARGVDGAESLRAAAGGREGCLEGFYAWVTGLMRRYRYVK